MTPPPCLCKCGCGIALTPKQLKRHGLYAKRTCFLASIPKEIRVARSKAYVSAHAELFKAAGAKGNKAWRQRRWSDLLDRFAEAAQKHGPSAGFARAYRRGWHSGYLSGRRAASEPQP